MLRKSSFIVMIDKGDWTQDTFTHLYAIWHAD